jgi:hypothetical protein
VSEELTDTDILKTAVNCGIILCSLYGKESGKPMPVSDHKTVVEFAREIIRDDRSKRKEST